MLDPLHNVKRTHKPNLLFFRNNAVSPINQLLCTLRYYATGSTQLSAADFSGFSVSTANRIVHRVTSAIANLRPLYVKFPSTEEELVQTQREFYKIAAFPRTIGAIDCTHIKICSPGGQDAEIFRNRKNYFSINTQVICNANMEITDIVTRWPGSTHDMHIFNACSRKTLLDNGTYGNCILVADGGYQNLPYMMIPLDQPLLPEENLFNESQIRTRNVVERLFGCWKRRFPILSLGINVKLERTMPIIVATAVLHNLLRRKNNPPPQDDPDLQLPLPWAQLLHEGQIAPVEQLGRRRNNEIRTALINNYFRSLTRN